MNIFNKKILVKAIIATVTALTIHIGFASAAAQEPLLLCDEKATTEQKSGDVEKIQILQEKVSALEAMLPKKLEELKTAQAELSEITKNSNKEEELKIQRKILTIKKEILAVKKENLSYKKEILQLKKKVSQITHKKKTEQKELELNKPRHTGLIIKSDRSAQSKLKMEIQERVEAKRIETTSRIKFIETQLKYGQFTAEEGKQLIAELDQLKHCPSYGDSAPDVVVWDQLQKDSPKPTTQPAPAQASQSVQKNAQPESKPEEMFWGEWSTDEHPTENQSSIISTEEWPLPQDVKPGKAPVKVEIPDVKTYASILKKSTAE